MVSERIMIRWFSQLSYIDKLSLYEGKEKLGVEIGVDEDDALVENSEVKEKNGK